MKHYNTTEHTVNRMSIDICLILWRQTFYALIVALAMNSLKLLNAVLVVSTVVGCSNSSKIHV